MDGFNLRSKIVRRATCALLLTGLLIPGAALASEAEVTTVPLPYSFRDDINSNWDIQPDGSIGDGGNNLYDGGCHLLINNQPFTPAAPGTATFDSDRNELTIPPMQFSGVSITRRVAVNTHENWCRYTEIIDNPGANSVKLQLHINFNIGQPVSTIASDIDVKHKNQELGVTIGNQVNFVSIIGAGHGAHVQPRLQYQQNEKDVNLFYDVEIPARQKIAVVHVQVRRPSFDQCVQAVSQIKDKDYLKGIDSAMARKIVNFNAGTKFIGNQEILRGDLQDVIELTTGDQYKGTIELDRYKLNAFYGAIDLPADRIVAMINVGKFKPRQLLVTSDGEIFGGELQSPTVRLEMSSGQITDVPLSQISRLGYRKRAGEPEDWTFTKPTVSMRSGDKIFVQPPTEPFAILTRYGWLKIKPEAISSILFQTDEHAVHEVLLTDGGHFTGLVEAPELQFILGDSPTGQIVKFPTGSLLKLDLAPAPDPDPDDPALALANDDALVGSLTGQIKIATAFDTINVEAGQIAHLEHGDGANLDVQITLWDNTVISGQLQSPDLACALKCGTTLDIPAALVQQYDQPTPQPSAPMVERVKSEVADLNGDDWKSRDEAENVLVEMGPVIMGILKQVKPAQSPEAQQRIDAILARLDKQKHPALPPDSTPMNKE